MIPETHLRRENNSMSSISDETYHLENLSLVPDDDVVICRCEEITRGEIRRRSTPACTR